VASGGLFSDRPTNFQAFVYFCGPCSAMGVAFSTEEQDVNERSTELKWEVN
jgi:hypothetical protein